MQSQNWSRPNFASSRAKQADTLLLSLQMHTAVFCYFDLKRFSLQEETHDFCELDIFYSQKPPWKLPTTPRKWASEKNMSSTLSSSMLQKTHLHDGQITRFTLVWFTGAGRRSSIASHIVIQVFCGRLNIVDSMRQCDEVFSILEQGNHRIWLMMKVIN